MTLVIDRPHWQGDTFIKRFQEHKNAQARESGFLCD